MQSCICWDCIEALNDHSVHYVCYSWPCRMLCLCVHGMQFLFSLKDKQISMHWSTIMHHPSGLRPEKWPVVTFLQLLCALFESQSRQCKIFSLFSTFTHTFHPAYKVSTEQQHTLPYLTHRTSSTSWLRLLIGLRQDTLCESLPSIPCNVTIFILPMPCALSPISRSPVHAVIIWFPWQMKRLKPSLQRESYD